MGNKNVKHTEVYDILSVTESQIDVQTFVESPKDIRIAALGAGGSGKTLTLKRLRSMVDGFSNEEMNNHRFSIINNMFVTMVNMINYVLPKDLDNNRDFSKLIYPDSKKHIQTILSAQSKWERERPKSVIEGVYYLWKNEPIFQKAYRERHEIQFPCEHVIEMIENYEIFLDETEPICNDWCLKAQLKTVGICSSEFLLDLSTKIKWIDTGGQSSERKKWPHIYDRIDGVVYFASLSEFMETCYEDEKTNRMLDSLDLFKRVSNDPKLQHVPLVLLFNKYDLFKKRIVEFDLSWLFPDLPAELRTTSGIDRTTDDFAMQNVMFIANKFLSTVKDREKREWIKKNLQVGSMIDEKDFKRITDACVEIFGTAEEQNDEKTDY
jgi:GTPase SAR1 family protein